jgi:hypothetical protein
MIGVVQSYPHSGDAAHPAEVSVCNRSVFEREQSHPLVIADGPALAVIVEMHGYTIDAGSIPSAEGPGIK